MMYIFSFRISTLDVNHRCARTMSAVLLCVMYALCENDRYLSIFSFDRSRTIFSNTFLIIGSSVIARKFSTGPFGLLTAAKIPFPISISVCSSKHLFNVYVISSRSTAGPYLTISADIMSKPGARLLLSFLTAFVT